MFPGNSASARRLVRVTVIIVGLLGEGPSSAQATSSCSSRPHARTGAQSEKPLPSLSLTMAETFLSLARVMYARYRIVSATPHISVQLAFPRADAGAYLCISTAINNCNAMPSIVPTLKIPLLQEIPSKLLLRPDVYRCPQSSRLYQQNLHAVSQASIIYAVFMPGIQIALLVHLHPYFRSTSVATLVLLSQKCKCVQGDLHQSGQRWLMAMS